jgi:exosortase A-associated hydrolase 1
LLLARYLAQHGTPVLRFDYRGMGDSQGESICFEDAERDIRAAADILFERIAGLTDIVIWGLCDAASAAMMYAFQDTRISGLVLANPWARTEKTIAKTYLHHYYRARVFDWALWKGIITGKVNIARSMAEFLQVVRRTMRIARKSSAAPSSTVLDEVPYLQRMQSGLKEFTGQVLFIISGDDLTASELSDLVAEPGQWQELMMRPNVQRKDLAEANHTFSRKAWRDEVADWTDEWLKSW